MANCIICHQRVASGGDRHAKGQCPAKKKEREQKENEVQAGDLATPGRGDVVPLAGKTSTQLSNKGKSRGSKSG
ncbi:MAG: hypothetical protein WC663_01920 [Patescibacteria group bacterium]|jgi:hypothetical protein